MCGIIPTMSGRRLTHGQFTASAPLGLRVSRNRVEFRYLGTENSDGYTNRDGSHRRYPAQFRCKERGRALEGGGALQGVDRRRLYRGGPYRVRRGGREAHL